MKNTYLLLLLFTGIANAQFVDIPDANFKDKLIHSNCFDTGTDQVGDVNIDTNADGEIDFTEAAAITNLIIDNANIVDLTGIEAFTNLNLLVCDHNLISSFDATILPQLITLEISNNPLSSLNLAGMPNFSLLFCNDTLLTSLDFSTNPNMSGLDANNCPQLTSINASGHPGFNFNVFNTPNIQTLHLNGCTGVPGGYIDYLITQLSNLRSLDVSGIQGMTMLSFHGDFLNITGCTSLQILLLSGPVCASVDLSSMVNLTDLELKNGGLTSLNLSGLTNLRYLNCSNNFLTSIDLSAQNNLTNLWVDHNQLGSLTISGLSQLDVLFCDHNLLNLLDLGSLSNLRALNCSNNFISTLYVSNLSQLLTLDIGNNPISAIDITNNPLIDSLAINNTEITAINLSNTLNLHDFSFQNTGIQTMDLSPMTKLFSANFGSDSLVDLNLKNGKNEIITFTDSPNLQFVCADDGQISNVQTLVNTDTVVSSYCSFVPGGDYNTVSGVVKWDNDNNGCDNSDSNFPYNVLMSLSNATSSSATFLNANGDYRLYAETGNYTLNPQIEQPTYFNIDPAAATINFPALDNSIATQNFCITPNGVHPDLEIMIAPIRNARPGFDANYKIIYKNKGNQMVSGTVDLMFDDARMDYVIANPAIDSQTTDHLFWNFANLLPFETKAINLTLNVNSPLENPAVNSGDILDFTTNINLFEGDATPEDNAFEWHQNVVNSLDPNDKTCLEGNTIAANAIGKYVHYNINFENTGTANAVNVVVKDSIDASRFDMGSLKLIYASHPVYTKITGNVVEFVFGNINLPPSNIQPIGGHGNVLFKIKTIENLVVGDEITNTANIYFDYNAPILTNEARTRIANLSNSDFVKDESVTIAPNPAKNNITVTAKNNLQSILLFDAQGRLLQTILENKKATSIDISEQAQGVYFVKVTTEKGSDVQKVIKQ